MAAGFSRVEKRRQALEARKDILSDLNRVIPWEEFRRCLGVLSVPAPQSKAGRKSIDRLLLFKLLIVQQWYHLSDEELEYQTHVRASFRRCVGLAPETEVPDAKTIWLFRQQLTQAGLIEELFETFNQYLEGCGYAAKGGQIIDATLVPVPIQRNSRDENKLIQQEDVPPEWNDTPHTYSQKDRDARWMKKNGERHFGYKNHINIDAAYGFIRMHSVTDAAVHDSQQFCQVLDGDNAGDEIWADGAYRNQAVEAGLELVGYRSQIHERGYRNHPLTQAQKATN